MSTQKKWFVLVNPTSGGGRGKKHWPGIKTELENNGLNFVFSFTNHPGHGLDLISNAIDRGYVDFIAVGGDGTMHEAVNAIMGQQRVPHEKFCVALIPVGTGNDWARHYGIPKAYKDAVKRISEENIIAQDIGKIILKDQPQKPIFFNNLAGIGFDGYVVEKVHRFKHWGAMAYLLGALSGLFTYKPFKAEIHSEGVNYQGRIFMLIIGIGTYSGGGMRLTRDPDPSDGLFDISLLPAQNRFRILRMLPSLFNGSVTNNKTVETGVVKALTVNIHEPASATIQADGEPIEAGSFKVGILTRALRFCV